jgi:hypothetical protein
MFTEAVLLIAGLAGTLGVGLPLASSLATPHRWRSIWSSDRPARQERERVDVTPAYKPLDLGPDPTRWPSERAWPTTTTLREPQWPSRSWNDEHFGSHWRNSTADHVQDRGFHAMASRRPGAPTSEVATPARPPPRPATAQSQRAQAAEDSWFDTDPSSALETPEETRRRASEQRRKQQQAAAGQEKRRQQQQQPARPQQQRAKPQPKPQVATIPDPRARSRAAEPPERADLERLIETVGLAGTVQAIMDRTGWEFREAAHYLAKIRNSR